MHFNSVVVVIVVEQVAFECAQFGLALLKDMVSGGFAAHEKERALQLRNTIERLGPAYIKVAQALSTRVDLLTPEYFMQIQLLQVCISINCLYCETANGSSNQLLSGVDV